jgi:hypothetical protein
VVAAKENEKCTSNGREEAQPILDEHVVMELSPSCLVPHLVLLCLVVPIQRRQVDVRGRLVLRWVGVLGLE